MARLSIEKEKAYREVFKAFHELVIAHDTCTKVQYQKAENAFVEAVSNLSNKSDSKK